MFIAIVNPVAGNGKTVVLLPEIERVLDQYHLTHCVKMTEYVGHAAKLAKEAALQDAQGVLAVGGDGTVSEALTGLAGSDVPLIYVPCGTGNDFVKSLHLPKDPIAALQFQLKQEIPGKRLDYARVNDRCFMNVSGTGFDVEVLRHTLKYKTKYRGLFAYLLGVIDAVRFFTPIECEIRIDDQAPTRGRYSIISVGNGQYIGGGMKAVPDARPDDGYLNVVTVGAIKKWQVLCLMPFFVCGKHTRLSFAHTFQCKNITIKRAGMTFQMDGELHEIDEAVIQIESAGLNTYLP